MLDLDDRIVLTPRLVRRDHLQGAWWPTSTDVTAELKWMLSTAVAQQHVVTGVTLNRDEWPDAPLVVRALTTKNPTVNWYGLAEANLAVLHGRNGRLALLVVPPETPDEVAHAAMRMASTPGNLLTTAETMSEAYARAA